MLGRGLSGAPRYVGRVVQALPSTLPSLEHCHRSSHFGANDGENHRAGDVARSGGANLGC